MLGAPPGFIPLFPEFIVNARMIIAVYEEKDFESVFDEKISRWEVKDLHTTHLIVVYSREGNPNRAFVKDMSLVQFTARMIEAMNETQHKEI